MLFSTPGAIISIVSLIATVFVFVAKVSLTASSEPNTDPFLSPFILKNETWPTLHDVKVQYFVNNMEGYTFHLTNTPGVSPRTRISGGMRLTSPEDKPLLAKLTWGEQTWLTYPERFFDRYSYCDIRIEISYRSAVLAWRETESFRFETRREKDGFVWMPKAMAEAVNITNQPPPEMIDGKLIGGITAIQPHPKVKPESITLDRKDFPNRPLK